MKENLTHIVALLDASGSMHPLVEDTIGGFNGFIDAQKSIPGEATVTLVTFNTTSKIVYDTVSLSSVPKLDKQTYKALGGTALFDALGSTIDSTGKKLASLKEEDRPSKVIFLIVTDGESNAGSIMDEARVKFKYTQDTVKGMVEHQSNAYKWEFLYFGANVDAFSNGKSLGLGANQSISYDSTSIGTRGLYSNISDRVTRHRQGK